jgi:3-(3-hydroxy-phenyl)propionate hydroxylase/6-hydroxy-3-succinoylpyridine 3-monooxygenase
VKTKKVVVVGAGPVGALTALGLAQRGHDVVLLEASSRLEPSPRANVYYWHVLPGLEALGVLDDMDEVGFRNHAFRQRVLSSGTQAEISLAPIASVTDRPWNLHLGQHQVVAIALEHLGRLPNAEIRWGSRVTGLRQDGQGVVLHMTGDDGPTEIRAEWVVGTDGARSTVRSSLGIGFSGTTWEDRFVATDIRYPFDQAGLGDANMVMDPHNGSVIARIDREGLWRWTWGESADLPAETVMDRLPGRLAALGFPDVPYEVVTATPYRMHQRSADRMRDARVLLAGDAAHATNPTGGLGLTAGMYDVFALLDPFDAVLRGGDAAALDAWADERLRIFVEHASPMATAAKHNVYDERDLTKLEAMVKGAGASVDEAEAVSRLSRMTVLRSGFPRHHAALT